MIAPVLPNLVYAALLLVVLLTPYASMYFRSFRDGNRLIDWLVIATITMGAIVLTVARADIFVALSMVLLIPLAGLGLCVLLGGIAAVLLFAPVTWWTSTLQIDLAAMGAFVALALTAGLMPRLGTSFRSVDGCGAVQQKILLPMIVCAAVGLAAGLLTAPFGSVEPSYIAWHHWSAYLSPVDAWLSGGLPYRDFPLQYGLGPTALLAATCGKDCWRGIYAVAITANALYFAMLAGCALILTARSSRGLRWLALLALFCASFVWTGFPIKLAGPAMTPSVAGLRFLVISALLLHILVAEQRTAPRDWIGHAIWLVSLFWSPEAAFFGTLIWWPYLAMRDAAGAAGPRGALFALGRGALRGVIALAIGLSGLALVLWLLSGKAITLGDYLAYIQHPPGPLPVNPVGTVWIALASIALGTYMLAGQGLSSQARALYACLLGFLAAGTYYLSRSHDNNILNLFPLLIPMLLAILAGPGRERTGAPGPDFAKGPDFARGFVQTVLVAMVAFVATFNFIPWSNGAARLGLLELGPAKLIARFTPKHGDLPSLLPPDAVVGLEYLRGRNAGTIVLLKETGVMPRSPAGTGWTSVNNVANFEPFPDAMIERYIRRGAVTYHRPGWLLVDDAKYHHWVDMFKTAYDVREQKRFGTYSAYYLVPR